MSKRVIYVYNYFSLTLSTGEIYVVKAWETGILGKQYYNKK